MDIKKILGTGGVSMDLLTNKEQIFTTSGTFTAPKTGKYIVYGLGGGGGGGAIAHVGSSSYSGSIAGGGMCGALATKIIEAIEGDILNIIIGAGGAGGSASGNDQQNGSSGGNTRIEIDNDIIFVAGGGGGGTGYYTSTTFNYPFGNPFYSSVQNLYAGHYRGGYKGDYSYWWSDLGITIEINKVVKFRKDVPYYEAPDEFPIGTASNNSSYRATTSTGSSGINGRGGIGSGVYNADAIGEDGIGIGSGGGGAATCGSDSHSATGGNGKDGFLAIQWFEE